MNREFRIAIAVCGLLGATSCQGVLDVTPKDQFPDQAVFADPNLAQAFLSDAYRGLGHGLYEIMLASMTDETRSEERRVGKEGRSRWSSHAQQKRSPKIVEMPGMSDSVIGRMS